MGGEMTPWVATMGADPMGGHGWDKQVAEAKPRKREIWLIFLGTH